MKRYSSSVAFISYASVSVVADSAAAAFRLISGAGAVEAEPGPVSHNLPAEHEPDIQPGSVAYQVCGYPVVSGTLTSGPDHVASPFRPDVVAYYSFMAVRGKLFASSESLANAVLKVTEMDERGPEKTYLNIQLARHRLTERSLAELAGRGWPVKRCRIGWFYPPCVTADGSPCYVGELYQVSLPCSSTSDRSGT